MVLLVSSLVSAFGVSSPYWETNPAKMYPGQKLIINLNAQNLAGATEDVLASINVKEGANIIMLDKSSYTIKAGETKDIPVVLKIPANAVVGSAYPVIIEVKTGSAGESGAVAIGVGANIKFNVEIIQKTEEVEDQENYNLLIGVVIAVLVIIIIYLLYKGKNKKRKR